jgi:hypothetical protein
LSLLDQGTHEDQHTREKRMARERYRHAMSGDKKDEILAKKREYQHNYWAKLSAAAKSKKFLASKVNMSGMIVIYFFNRLNIFYFILITIYVVSNMSYIR